jgi:hypothetical protein
MSALDDLTKSMATTATGYAAVLNGVLDATTTSASRKSAAMKALVASGVPAFAVMLLGCDKDGCDCVEKAFVAEVDGGRIVPVKVEVSQ